MTSEKHYYPRTRVYFSAAIAVLCTILTVHILYIEGRLFLLLYYFAFTALIAAIVFILRTQPLFEKLRSSGEKKPQTEGERPGWKALIIIFCMLFALLFIPLFLSSVLDPSSWFILIVSLTSGLSIAEVLLYVHAK